VCALILCDTLTHARAQTRRVFAPVVGAQVSARRRHMDRDGIREGGCVLREGVTVCTVRHTLCAVTAVFVSMVCTHSHARCLSLSLSRCAQWCALAGSAALFHLKYGLLLSVSDVYVCASTGGDLDLFVFTRICVGQRAKITKQTTTRVK
jgi:hypothetical protein